MIIVNCGLFLGWHFGSAARQFLASPVASNNKYGAFVFDAAGFALEIRPRLTSLLSRSTAEIERFSLDPANTVCKDYVTFARLTAYGREP